MKKRSRLAVVSFVLGCIGGWCGMILGGPFLLLAIPIGVCAALTGGFALRSIRKAPTPQSGRGLAVFGLGFGVAVAVFAAATLASLISQQISMQTSGRRNWDQDRQAAEVEAENKMRDEPADHFTSNLPIVVLDTAGQSVSKDAETIVRSRFYDLNQGRAAVSAKPSYEGGASIHVRGYSTLHLPKHSYTLHTLDAQNNQVKVGLLGLPAEEDWVLYAPYEDKTLIRDVLAYDLARAMGHYAPRTRYVELFIRRSDRALSMRDYVGVYVLVEKIKRAKERVNIAKLESSDRSEPAITGGYIIKRDHSERGDERFRTRNGGPYSYVYPNAAKISLEQKRWIKQYLNAFETALNGPDFADPQSGYAAYLDVPSFIDAHWLIEMSKNVDGFRYSSFLTKDRGGKLRPEPPWDWNRAFGNANYYGGGQPNGWYWKNLRPNEISWYRRLREDPAFAKACAARWVELRKGVFDTKAIHRRIDELAAQLEEAQQRNFRRWPVLGRQVTCNAYVGRTYPNEVDWLKKWVSRRVAWIDGQIGNQGED